MDRDRRVTRLEINEKELAVDARLAMGLVQREVAAQIEAANRPAPPALRVHEYPDLPNDGSHVWFNENGCAWKTGEGAIAHVVKLGDRLEGTASKAGGAERPASFTRLAADPEGTWREDAESSLTFAEPVLDWFDGEQKVVADVSGAIFGRAGKGKLSMYGGRRMLGSFEATDWSYSNRCLDRRPFMRQESYERDCPKEGWWGADHLFLSLDVSADGALMAGKVTPSGRRKDSDIEAHVHLERVVRSASGLRSRSLL